MPVANLALKTLEVVSSSKEKLYICNEKELKLLLTKIQTVALLDIDLTKLIVVYFNFISFSLEKNI